MGFDEAVALLGLTPPFTAKDVRRAYLRLLKVHKPESDPEGFMRLREAYEMFDGVESVGARPLEREPLVDASATGDLEAKDEIAEPLPEVEEGTLPPWQRAVPEDAKDAAALLAEWLERAKSDPTAPPPPMTSSLRVLWSMLDRRAFKTAGRLYRAIDDWLLQVGGARGELAWGMTQGLWEMRRDIPEQLYSPIVRGVASESPGVAADALRSYAREAPGLAGALQRRMAARSPELAAVFNAYLMPYAEQRLAPAPPTRPWFSYGWLIVVIGLAVVRVVASSPSSSSRSESPPASRAAFLKQVAGTRANALASAADAAGLPELAGHARSLSIAMANELCMKAHEALAACQALVASNDSHKASLAPLLHEVESPVLEHCGPPPKQKPLTVAPSASATPSAFAPLPAPFK